LQPFSKELLFLIQQKMKAFTAVVATVAATATAEPFYGLGYGYGGYALASPCRNAYGAPVPCAALKKREAEAEPWYPYAYGLGAWGYNWGKSAPCVNAANEPVPCAAWGKKKRDADAQFIAPYGAYGLGYGGYYGGLYGYGLAAPAFVTYESDCKNAWGFSVPCAAETPKEETKEKRSADAQFIAPYSYGAYGLGYGGYYGGLYGYGLAAPAFVTYKSDCKNAWGFDVPCAAETPKEETKEKRSADPQVYLGAGAWGPWGYGAGWGYGAPLIHSSNFGICTNYKGEKVDC